jgi:hypothetical protein
MDQQDKQAKPRKRFVGKARNQEANTADPNSIEDGAVGFASKLLLPLLTLYSNVSHSNSFRNWISCHLQNLQLDPPLAEWQIRFQTKS